jgi:hypothetical protein
MHLKWWEVICWKCLLLEIGLCLNQHGQAKMSSNVFEGKDERLQAGCVMVGKSSRVEQHIG